MFIKSFDLFRKYVVLLSVITLTFSCKKFLSKKNNENITVPTTLSDLQLLLDDASIMNSGTPAFGESSANDYFLLPSMISSLPEEYKQYYTWQPIEYYGGDWHAPAQAIYNSNLCLEILPTTAHNNQSNWNNVKGSALFFRSYYFLGLLWDYSKAWNSQTSSSDMGIMLRTSSDFNKAYNRATVSQCYEKILKDVKEAASLLPTLPTVATRPSKVAAFGLLARIFWSMRDYDNALLYADSCLMLKNSLMDFNDAADVSINANAPFKALNAETIFYSVMNRNSSLALCYPYMALVDTILYNSYDSSDLRNTAFFTSNNNFYQFKGSYVSSPVNDLFTGIATDELYLIKAECLIRKNKTPEGISVLDELLETRWKAGSYLSLGIMDRQEALAKVLAERRKELLFRGLRWIDIKRQNIEDAGILLQRKINEETYLLRPNDPYYALPLPIDLIRVTGIEQN